MKASLKRGHSPFLAPDAETPYNIDPESKKR